MSIAATTTATGTSQSTTSNSSAAASTAATNSLTGNFNDFLTLLTTQLQNQDPTSPMDTNQFTSQLVEFAGVEQQVNTNTNLTTLINLTQASSLYQSSAMMGHQIGVTASQLSLQNGNAELQYTLTTPQPVNVTISNASGVAVYQTSLNGSTGSNTWSWNGVGTDGQTQPDGPYNVSVTTATGASTAIPFSVVGTVTGVTMNGSTPTIALGQLSVPMSSVSAVIN